MGVDKPNYTQMPNLLLDDLLMQMGEAEMKVTIALSRLTFGYHREKVEISLSHLQEITHLSRQGVINGINAGLERGTIDRSEGKRGGFIYTISVNGEQRPTSQRSRLVNEVDHPATSQPNGLPLVNEVDQSSQRSRPVVVNEVDQNTPVLKKDIKERTTKKVKETPRARSRSGDTHPNTQPIMEAYIAELGYKPAHYGKESSAAKQLAKDGYEPVDVVASYRLLKSEAFWRSKHLSLQSVAEQIPAMKQALLQGAPLARAPANGNGHMSKGARQEEEVDRAFRLLETRGIGQ